MVTRRHGPLFIVNLVNAVSTSAVLDSSKAVVRELVSLLSFAEMTAIAVERETVLVANPDLLTQPNLRGEAITMAAGLRTVGGPSSASTSLGGFPY